MKKMVALIGVCTMIGLAAPAYADPQEGGGVDEAGFLAALRQAGISYGNPSQAVGSANAVCTCLDHGESGLELVQDVKTHNPGLDMDAAAQFAVISSKYFCPHHLAHA
ncbi:DUF732 domain-containing protein [Mycobacterium sp. ML4]